MALSWPRKALYVNYYDLTGMMVRARKTQGPKETMVLTLEEEEAMITAQPTDLDNRGEEVKMAQRRVGELLWLSEERDQISSM